MLTLVTTSFAAKSKPTPASSLSRRESFDDLEVDVRQSIARIQASPFIPVKDNIRGFIYDVKTGRLNEVT